MTSIRSPKPIVISLEAKFHHIRNVDWNNKLIQGLHLSKEKSNGIDSRITGSLLCYGPMKEHSPDWSLSFDHAFTLSSKRIGCASPIKKSFSFNRRNHAISASEWGDHKNPMPENWELHDHVKLSCHMYITQTFGFDRKELIKTEGLYPLENFSVKNARNMSSASSSCSPTLSSAASSSTSLSTVPAVQTRAQIEKEVMQCFREILAEENIEYTQTAFEAAKKLSKFFCFPSVIDVCRRHLMKQQSRNRTIPGETAEVREEYKRMRFNLHGFDFAGNTVSRKQRMDNLDEDDIVAIFQHLCMIAFRKA
uniref:Uncharacterized protein n=1 Tax=Caenorhabditis japonica TaxID=281687 RepID=A0A8R1ERY9_CAEJA